MKTSTTLNSIRKDNARIVKLLAKAATQEPKSGQQAWITHSASNMRDVVTFKTEGKSKGSLERFAEANKMPKAVYEILREAAAYGGHSTQGAVNGILAFDVKPSNLKKLEAKLNKIYTSRDKNKNGAIDDGAEKASIEKLKNGKAFFAGRAKLQKTKLTGLKTEHKFSRQVQYLVDLMYSKGSIYGPSHIDNVVKDMPSAEAKAVRAAYASVSRYISKGNSGALNFICRDQRREVTRGLMRVYGASLDTTEKAIRALKLPKGY